MDIASRTVLVVEDDSMVLMGLQMILETWGMTVLPAEDLQQVLDHIEPHAKRETKMGHPDLILSDLHLRAGLSGFDVVERVRGMLGTEVPAIILTGETGKDELAEGRRRNCTFLHKPIQPEPLRCAITAVTSTPKG